LCKVMMKIGAKMINTYTMNKHRCNRCNTGAIAPQLHRCKGANVYAPLHLHHYLHHRE
jgi:hypothetical protein